MADGILLIAGVPLKATDNGDGTLSLSTSTSTVSGPANQDNGQVAMGAAQTQIVPARTTDRAVLVQNLDASLGVWLGKTGVLAGTGIFLGPGQSVVLNARIAIYGLAASGTPTVAFWDEWK